MIPVQDDATAGCLGINENRTGDEYVDIIWLVVKFLRTICFITSWSVLFEPRKTLVDSSVYLGEYTHTKNRVMIIYMYRESYRQPE